MLYHVRLSVAGQRQDETKLDLTEDQLEQQFLKPYREGQPLTVNGRSVDAANLQRIRITQSEGSARDFIPHIQAEDRASPVAMIGGPPYTWRAAGRAQDVTDDLVKGPPGYAATADKEPVESDRRLRRVTVPAGPGDGRSVFLINGRNARLAESMRQMLRSLDLKVIEWEQAVAMTGEPNPYIGDVIAAGLEAADAVVVLATPDDIVRLDPDLADGPNDAELQEARQPRQNVIYCAPLPPTGQDRVSRCDREDG